MVRLREEKLVNRALAGWLIHCIAGTQSFLFQVFFPNRKTTMLLRVLQHCNFLRKQVLPEILVCS